MTRLLRERNTAVAAVPIGYASDLTYVARQARQMGERSVITSDPDYFKHLESRTVEQAINDDPKLLQLYRHFNLLTAQIGHTSLRPLSSEGPDAEDDLIRYNVSRIIRDRLAAKELTIALPEKKCYVALALSHYAVGTIEASDPHHLYSAPYNTTPANQVVFWAELQSHLEI